MGKPAPVGTCDVEVEIALADSKAKALGLQPTTYAHKEYFVPYAFGSCEWGGLALVGCNRAGHSTVDNACWAMIRDQYPTTRLHEFGHNLGLYHAGDPDTEYGDSSGLMGSARAWHG